MFVNDQTLHHDKESLTPPFREYFGPVNSEKSLSFPTFYSCVHESDGGALCFSSNQEVSDYLRQPYKGLV